MSHLSAPHFHNEEAAFAFVEGILWPAGPVCPHCGGVERITTIKANPEKRVRHGLKRCGQPPHYHCPSLAQAMTEAIERATRGH